MQITQQYVVECDSTRPVNTK